MNRLLHILLLCCLVTSVRAIDVAGTLLTGSTMHHASVGVHIVDVDTREVVASYQADKALSPASVVKVLTAATILECYPDTTRWYTTMGYDGTRSDSVLQGNIIVRGAADPALAHDKLQQSRTALLDAMVKAVERAGIKHIEGDIIVDASICAMDINGSWMLEDVGHAYGASCYGLNYCGNEYKLYLRTGAVGSRPHIIGESDYIYPIVHHNFLTVDTDDTSLVQSMPYADDCYLWGTVPQMRDSFELKCAVPDPPALLAYDLRNALLAADIAVSGQAVTHHDCIDKGRAVPVWHTHLYTHASLPLYPMLRYMMHRSNNLYAEAMLAYIGLSQDSVARSEQSLQTMCAMWRDRGLDVNGLKLYDGSGLSRKNLMTPRFMASLLVEAYHDSRLGQDFVNLFPRAGREGSVRSFFAKNPLPGVLRVKSGSMGGVLCYAGYYTYRNKTYAVVLMSNNHTCKATEVRRRYEKLLRDLWAAKK